MGEQAAPRPSPEDAHLVSIGSIPVPACLLDSQGSVLAGSPAWDEAFGHSRASWTDEGEVDLRRQLRTAAMTDAPFGIEASIRGADGEQRSYLGRCSPVDLPAVPEAVTLCVLIETTAIKHREAQLAFMATHDVLTGLPNRRMFEDSLERALARARRGNPGSLIMLDVDNLKAYNDALGHASGDQALINISLLLQTHVRAGDMLARIGGDEFGVILEESSLDEAVEIGERMRAAAAEEAFVADARTYGLGLSAGVVVFDGSEEPSELMEAADTALYEAKNTGRNRVVVSSAHEQEKIENEERVTRTVRQALHSGEILLHYQPVVRLSDGSIAYFEALMRLCSSDGELLEPVLFLGTAERLGLMPRLTRAALDGVFAVLTSVDAIRVSVNLCGSDLLDKTLPDYIEEQLANHAVEPDRLLFELSETVAASHRDVLPSWFERITGLGCEMVLDRFEAGSRGLTLISTFGFSQVKLDASALSRFTGQGDGGEYLEAVRRVVEAHGLAIVGFRIEDPGALQQLRDAGYPYAQGYGVGEPRATPE